MSSMSANRGGDARPLPVARSSFYTRTGKRIVDLVVGTALAVATLPLQAMVALLVRRNLGAPVLFRQTRPGVAAEPFQMIKFRTMSSECDTNGEPLPDAARLSPFGQFLRSTSLDELPELYNVLKGDMSLVGPRPLLMRYVSRYTVRQSQRHAIRPGLTGLAQVMGRNNQSWEAKFDLDLEYVCEVSFLLDLRILILTAWKVLRRVDVNTDGHTTAPEFGMAPNTTDPG